MALLAGWQAGGAQNIPFAQASFLRSGANSAASAVGLLVSKYGSRKRFTRPNNDGTTNWTRNVTSGTDKHMPMPVKAIVAVGTETNFVGMIPI